jgi:hypothetical protein
MTCECADHAQLEGVMQAQRPDLVLLGLSAGAKKARKC